MRHIQLRKEELWVLWQWIVLLGREMETAAEHCSLYESPLNTRLESSQDSRGYRLGL